MKCENCGEKIEAIDIIIKGYESDTMIVDLTPIETIQKCYFCKKIYCRRCLYYNIKDSQRKIPYCKNCEAIGIAASNEILQNVINIKEVYRDYQKYIK